MSDDASGEQSAPTRSVPIDSIPAPVIAYDIQNGDPLLVGVNERFETTFGSTSTAVPIRRWLREVIGVNGSLVESIQSSLRDGERIDREFEASEPAGRRSEARQYRFRTFDDPGVEAGGFVLLTESPSDNADGVETDRIASVISHDLRNPLDVANAHLRAARETGEEEHFEEVKQAHDRMEQIIQDVLTLARGKSALSITANVDIEAIAADAWASVDTGEASLTLGDDLSTTAADPDRLQRLFENLFRNSVEHADPPAAADAAAADTNRPRDADSDRRLQIRVGSADVGFFVADNGPGVPPEDRSRVFDPGYSSNETGRGTGLGLTIVEEIADAHGWSVSLTTGSLGGARFEFQPSSQVDRDDSSDEVDKS